MNNLEYEKELANLTVPQLIDRIQELTESYMWKLSRIADELMVRELEREE